MNHADIIVVKIGSESLSNFMYSEKVTAVIDSIGKKISEGSRVLLVSSGAVAFGKKHYPEINNKQVLAALGWHHLLSAYSNKIRSYGIGIAGFLVTHADIEDQESRAQTFQETIYATWNEGLLPIVNENDPISTEEMREVGRGADNDKNSLLLAKLFQAKLLILITNTDGVYEDISNANTRIPQITSNSLTQEYIDQLCHGKSDTGTGGMASKLAVAHEAGKYGVTTHIGDGVHSGIFDLNSGGTTITPQNSFSFGEKC